MDVYNLTTVTQFILIELSDLPEVRYPLFVAFVIIYQITLLGNGAILLAILYFLVALAGTEVFLLAVMAYD
ncbi:hypothetical protein A6R68_05728, partial [Neotoma lepida]